MDTCPDGANEHSKYIGPRTKEMIESIPEEDDDEPTYRDPANF